MSKRLPKWQLHQILVAFLFDWTVKCIAAATKLHLSTIYRIQLNLDLYGEPYPPLILRLGDQVIYQRNMSKFVIYDIMVLGILTVYAGASCLLRRSPYCLP